eukprot:scaffold546_cov113-Skeletonema_dohrnii-CCMP3373.AAC.10
MKKIFPPGRAKTISSISVLLRQTCKPKIVSSQRVESLYMNKCASEDLLDFLATYPKSITDSNGKLSHAFWHTLQPLWRVLARLGLGQQSPAIQTSFDSASSRYAPLNKSMKFLIFLPSSLENRLGMYPSTCPLLGRLLWQDTQMLLSPDALFWCYLVRYCLSRERGKF